MTPFRRAMANARILVAADGLNMLAGALTVIFLARFLDTAALGLYSLGFSIGSVLMILCLYGANALVIREIARDPEKFPSYLGYSLAVRGGMGLVLWVAASGALLLWGSSRERSLILIFLILTRLLEGFLFMLFSFFRGFQEMQYEGAFRIGLNVLNVGVGFPILFFSRSLFALVWVQSLLTALVLGITLAALRRRLSGASFPAFTWEGCRSFFKEAFPFSVYCMLLALYVQTNTILLSFFKGDEATGLYTAAFRIISALGMAAAGVTGAFYPALSRWKVDREAGATLEKAFFRPTATLLLLGLAASAALFFSAPWLIHMLYGPAYALSVAALRLMAFTVVFSFLNTAMSSALFALDQEAACLRNLWICLSFILAINLMLLPRWGVMGASLTTLLPEIFFFILQLRLLTRVFPKGAPATTTEELSHA